MQPRPRRKYWYKGKILHTCDILRMCGIPAQTYKMRVRRGWSLLRALTTPVSRDTPKVVEPDLVFEVISPKTARVDEVNKFELYQREGVAFYVVVYPAAKKAKVWQLVDGQYRKVADFQDEHYRFDLSKCSIEFDFGRLWKRKGAA